MQSVTVLIHTVFSRAPTRRYYAEAHAVSPPQHEIFEAQRGVFPPSPVMHASLPSALLTQKE
jgi:hypothetical protein